MLQFDTLATEKQQQVRRACAFLFSPEESRNKKFLNTINVKAVKTAFRRKAKMYHPDLHTDENFEMIERRRERFVKIRDSYEILVSVLPKDDKPVIWEVKKRRARVIAIGGAKGGIGKSLFAANLAVYLSKAGYKTVVADFDLGGANLHLYLGLTRVEKNLSDFLNRRVDRIEDIFTKTRFGPILISGNSSSLGAANIHFSKKMRLIQTVQEIDADYVVVDLGGDTSFNMLDFFNAADLNVVMTTCEPAAYLDAYNFIKVALLRRLSRQQGDDNDLGNDIRLKLNGVINNFITENDGTINKLIETVKRECPYGVGVINKILKSFSPLLLINKISDISESSQISKRIIDVADRMLSIRVETVRPILFEKIIEKSARELIPVTVSHQNAHLNEHLNEFVKKYII